MISWAPHWEITTLVAKFLAQQATSQQATYCLLNNEKGSHIYIYIYKKENPKQHLEYFINLLQSIRQDIH